GVLEPAGSRDGEVDRLAALVAEPAQARPGERDERLRGVTACVAEEDGPRPESSPCAEPLHEPLPLEGAHQPRGRALRQPGARRELADRRRLGRLDYAHA